MNNGQPQRSNRQRERRYDSICETGCAAYPHIRRLGRSPPIMEELNGQSCETENKNPPTIRFRNAGNLESTYQLIVQQHLAHPLITVISPVKSKIINVPSRQRVTLAQSHQPIFVPGL